MTNYRDKTEYFLEKLGSIFEISFIRLQKILHMGQISFMGLILSITSAPIINKYAFELNKDEETYIIFLKLALEMVILVIVLYYIRKITKLIPFLFQFTKDYNPVRKSSDGESLVGNTVAMAIVYANFLTKLKDKIKFDSTTGFTFALELVAKSYFLSKLAALRVVN